MAEAIARTLMVEPLRWARQNRHRIPGAPMLVLVLLASRSRHMYGARAFPAN